MAVVGAGVPCCVTVLDSMAVVEALVLHMVMSAMLRLSLHTHTHMHLENSESKP
jgi:hypothetical protein